MAVLSSMRILVVEGDALSTKVIIDLFKLNGFDDITCAASGEKCLKLLDDFVPDIALIDIVLPGINGLEVCKFLRSREETRHIPIIIITGGALSLKDAVLDSFEAGATDFITKPIDITVFTTRIKTAVKIKTYQDQLNHELLLRTQAEQELIKSEERLRLISQNMPVMIEAYDENGLIVAWNHECERVSGYRAEEVINHPEVQKKIYPGPEYKKTLRECIYQKKIIKNRELVLVAKYGSKRIISWSNFSGSYPVPGRATWSVGIDVTQRKEMEEALKNKEEQLRHAQKMEAIGTFAGGIAHDFNNLLYIISGNTEILLCKDNEEDATYLEEIFKSSQRGTDLVKQLLTFSRKAEVNLLPTSLNAEVKKVTQMLERVFPKMIHLELDIDKDLNLINADKSQIEQILVNLCLNARDAMNDNGRLRIRTENQVQENKLESLYPNSKGPWVKLSVSDTGCGMEKDVQERIFEPFFTTKEIGKGTGLGLSVIYGIVKAHDGFIFCESNLNTGTTFTLYFPVAKKITRIKSANPTAAVNEPIKGNETLLIADDEKSVLGITQSIIKLLGYQTITADSGESALEIFVQKHSEIDLVLLDLGMPGMGGKKCLEKIIDFKPEAKVLIASGYAKTGLVKDALNCGAKASIIKPYTMHELSKALRDVLDE